MSFAKYQILELESGASPEQIKRAYFRLVRLHSPEKDPEKFKEIQSAYEILSDPKARQAYDAVELHGDQISELSSEAETLMNEENWNEAAKRWKHLLLLMPQAQRAWNALGLCQLHVRSYEQATKTYRVLTKRNPETALYWHNCGAAYHEWATDDDTDEQKKNKLLGKARFSYRKGA